MFRYRSKDLANRITEKLKEMDLNLRLMHVCGTHQDTVVRYGLDEMLKEVGVELRPGPGCPVCVTTAHEIDIAVSLAQRGVVVTTFGDMFRVPGSNLSLADAKAKGCDVRVVYSISDAVSIAEKLNKEVVFFAIGFETTAPATAATILSGVPENFSVLSAHRLIPPAMEFLLKMGEIRIDGFINPGHVSTIIGEKAYEFISERYKIPQVIAGFEPLDVLFAVYMIANMVKRGEATVENEYRRVVRPYGNERAKRLIEEVFEPCDCVWRGFPVVNGSCLKLKEEFSEYDAERRFEDELKEVEAREAREARARGGEEASGKKGCICGEILRGISTPQDCELFGKVCTPSRPVGPCMVSREGSCNIEFRYRRGRL
ncbi:MAG: Hydrogenase maturation factor HypD [Methanophagales archaeon]|nr:hydrogenase formation protein HypD [Methanophagales archaeon]MCU4140033.1 Hydrogenase maturation factor HypD [Methanophagales archaeon]